MDEKIYQEIKKQTIFSMITMIAAISIFLVIIVAAVTIVPSANKALSDISTAAGELQVVATELEKADIGSLVSASNSLVEAGNESLAEAMEKINKVDFDGLNSAIKNLGDVVEPIAKFFNRF